MPPRRRSRGDGGLYKRSDGMWVGVVELPAGGDGKRKRATISSRNKATAMTKLRELQQQVTSGTFHVSDKTTVDTWLQHWLDAIKKPQVDPKTFGSYRGIIANQISPFIGTRRVDKLTAASVRDCLAEVGAQWSTRTTELTHFVLRKALDDAVKEGLIARNPAEHVAKPKLLRKDGKSLSAEDVRKFFAAATEAEDPMISRWGAALMLGSRQGELLGLQWDRVDLDNMTVELSWQLQWLKLKPGATMTDPNRFDVPKSFEHIPLYRTAALTRPKTERSKRLIPLPIELAGSLRYHQANSKPNEFGLVWATEKGNPIANAVDSKAWHAALKRAGVPDVPLHAARHTTATLLQEMGVDEHIRMAIMGHSSAAAQRGYAHVDLELARKALGNLNGMLTLPE